MQWDEEAEVIDTPVLERVLAEALRNGGDFAEVFAEDRSNSSALLDDGRVEELSSGRERGAGVRVVAGDTTGFAHTADLSERGLLRAAEAASAVARSGEDAGARRIALDDRRPGGDGTAPGGGDGSAGRAGGDKAAVLELLRRADEAGRGAGAAVSQVQAGYGAS